MSGGGTQGSSDTRFERKGTATTTSYRDLTPQHDGLFQTGFDATTPSSTGPNVANHVNGLLGLSNNDIPFQSEMGQIVNANLPGANVPGQDALNTQAAVDPYSGNYASNTFDRYQKELGTALAGVSGPLATRGGTAAQGFLGQEVMSDAALNREDVLKSNRVADSQIQQNAAQTLHGMQGRDTAEALQGIGQQQGSWASLVGNQNSSAGVGNQQAGLFSDLVQQYVNLDSVVNGVESNDLSGRGAQTSSSQGANLSLCCFIFMEGYHGKMPLHVRECRDEFAPESSDRRRGYIKMAKWLVPAMRVSKVARWAVDKLMIKPLTKWGGHYKKVEGYEHGKLYYPFVKFWFLVWECIGKTDKKGK